MMMERQWLPIAKGVGVALTGSYESVLEISLGPHQHVLAEKKAV